jgi:isopenicillin N synthase-like dioxygenase
MDIPTIDLSPFCNSSNQDMVTTANKIARACETIGAFYVTNSALSTFANDYKTL